MPANFLPTLLRLKDAATRGDIRVSECAEFIRNHADAIAELVKAVAEYEDECTNPSVDLMYRANRRKNMFDKLRKLDGQKEAG